MPPRPIEIAQLNGRPTLLTPKDRSLHLHVVGPPGSGKSRLLEHMAKQDMAAGHGVCVIDPMGNVYDRLVKWSVARGLHRRLVIHCFDPNSDEWVPSFNPLQRQPGEDVSKRVGAMALACARVWSEDQSKTPLLKRMLRIVFTALVEHDLTLIEGLDLILSPTDAEEADINTFLTRNVDNPYVKRVWAGLEKLKPERLEEMFSSTNNRMMEFLSSERMRRVFGFGEGSLDLRRCMDVGQILLVNLQPKQISEDDANLLGTLLLNELLGLARSRDNATAAKHPFYCHVDESYRFLNEDIEQALDETRQKGLHYTLYHQRLSQLRQAGDHIYGGVMSIRNKVIFGDLPADETETLARELFQGEFDEDLEIEKLRRPVVVDHELRRNRQHRVTQNEGQNVAQSLIESRNLIDSQSNALNLPIDPFGAPITGDFMDAGGVGSAKGRGKARAKAKGRSASTGTTDGWAEGAWPLLEERSGGLRSFDDQMHIYAKRLRVLPSRQVLLKLNRSMPSELNVPYVGDPIASQRRVPKFLAEAANRSGHIRSPQQVAERLRLRRVELLRVATQDSKVIEDEVDYFE